MNRDRIEGNWIQLYGMLQQRWGRLREDELRIIAGQRIQKAGELQEKYGIFRDQAARDLAEFRYRQRDWSTRR